MASYDLGLESRVSGVVVIGVTNVTAFAMAASKPNSVRK